MMSFSERGVRTMKSLWNWYNSLSYRCRTSISCALSFVGFIATIMTILGVSINNAVNNMLLSFLIIAGCILVISMLIYLAIGLIYKDSVTLMIKKTPISIVCGNIFETSGWKVIGCDTYFDTRVDDDVISKKSLHGQLVLNHGRVDEIKAAVEKEAKKRNIKVNSDGRYEFELGTIIKYESTKDNQTYLMLAMTKLNEFHQSHTNMAEFERMLMRMWTEIDRVYNSNEVVLPLLGSGISRFDDGPKSNDDLLRCILCTLNASGVSLKTNVKIVIYGDKRDMFLYEYKDIFRQIPKQR